MSEQWYADGCPPTKGEPDPIIEVTLHRREQGVEKKTATAEIRCDFDGCEEEAYMEVPTVLGRKSFCSPHGNYVAGKLMERAMSDRWAESEKQ
jgi:hypothetical protein